MRGDGMVRAGVVGAAVALCGFLQVPVLETPASAQGFRMETSTSLGGADGPPVTSEHMSRYAEALGLSADQAAAAQTMVEGLVERFTLEQVLMNERMMDLRAEAAESGDFRIYGEEIPEARARFGAAVDAMEASFFDDLRLLLTAEQEDRWGNLERVRRRLTTIGHGSMSGENVDLIELVGSLGVGDDVASELHPILGRYEMELDRALEARNSAQTQEMEVLDDARVGGMGRGELDMEALQRRTAAVREASLRVRDVNDSYARQIRGVLSGTAYIDEFERLWLRGAYPRVYRKTYTSTVVDAAMGYEDLTDEQRERLEMIAARYQRELERANEALVAAIREREEEGDSGVMLSTGMGMMRVSTESEDSAQARATRDRVDLNRDYLSQVRNLLSPTQRSRLPQREIPQSSPGSGGAMHFVTVEMSDDGGEDVDVDARD